MEKIKFHEHQWVICVDLNMVNFFLGQQGKWPTRENMVVGEKNVIREHLDSAPYKASVNQLIK